MTRRFLITGGAGFIGSNFIRHLLATEPDCMVTSIDSLTYAGMRLTVDDISDVRHRFIHGDIGNKTLLEDLLPGHDVVVNFAAETHVDRSIADPEPFLYSNVMALGTLLEIARRCDIPRFIQISTDEVYGSVPEGYAGEDAPLKPSSAYSASKAAADLLCQSYSVTYGYAPVITRCTNNYGPHQFPEKLIPLFITNLLERRPCPLYGDGMHERDWLFVDDHCAAIKLLVDEGVAGQIYNIATGRQVSNYVIARVILELLNRDASLIQLVDDRPGHDRRYALDASKLRALGWSPALDLETGIERTVAWYARNKRWWVQAREQGGRLSAERITRGSGAVAGPMRG